MICKLFHALEFSGFSSVAKPAQQFFLTWCFSYFSTSLGCLLNSLSQSKLNETVQLGTEYGKYICHCTWRVLSSWAHTVLWWVKQNLYIMKKQHNKMSICENSHYFLHFSLPLQALRSYAFEYQAHTKSALKYTSMFSSRFLYAMGLCSPIISHKHDWCCLPLTCMKKIQVLLQYSRYIINRKSLFYILYNYNCNN